MEQEGQRDTWAAITNGLKCRCPRCGQGRLFARYLKIAPACDHCGLDYSPHRADDLPAYIVITIVGHILVIGLMHFQASGAEIAPWVYLAWLVPLALFLPLAILPSVKGAIVGFQWSRRMHGF